MKTIVIAVGVEKSRQISDLDQEVKRLWDNLRKVFVIVPLVVGALCFVSIRLGKDLSTAGCLVTWPFNENEAGGDLVLIETLPFFFM